MLCRCTRRSPTLPSFFTQHPHIRTETRSTMADPFKLVDRLEEIDVLTETQKELLGDRAMDGEDITPVLRAWTRVG